MSTASSKKDSGKDSRALSRLASMASYLDRETLEAFATILGEIGEAAGILQGAPQLDGTPQHQEGPWTRSESAKVMPRIDPYTVVQKLYQLKMLNRLDPVLNRVGLSSNIIPVLTLLGVYGRSFVPWAISKYGKASIKLQVGEDADLAQYIARWAAQNSAATENKSSGRHITITEHVSGGGEHQTRNFQLLKSDVESWTVTWHERSFFIRVERYADVVQDVSTMNQQVDNNSGNFDNGGGGYYNHNNYNDDGQGTDQDQYAAVQQTQASTDIDYVLIECYGSDYSPISELIEHCKNEMLISTGKDQKITIHRMLANGTVQEDRATGRPLHTLDLPKELSVDLVQNAVDFFRPEVRNWTRENGEPWRRGYLFYGPPGTGKSSFVTALATHLKLKIYTLDLAGMTDSVLVQHWRNLPDDGCIVLLEDLDSAGLIRDDKGTDKRSKRKTPANKFKRSGSKAKEPIEDVDADGDEAEPRNRGSKQRKRSDSWEEREEEPKGVTISCLINLMDGVGAKEGRLLIITTNRPKSLDKRITRRGRITRPYRYFGFADKETATQTYRRMFGTYPINPPKGERLEHLAKAFGNQCPTNFLTGADLQEYCSGYRGKPEEAVEEFSAFIRTKRDGLEEPVYDMDENELKPEFDDDDDDDRHDADKNGGGDEDSDSENGGDDRGGKGSGPIAEAQPERQQDSEDGMGRSGSDEDTLGGQEGEESDTLNQDGSSGADEDQMSKISDTASVSSKMKVFAHWVADGTESDDETESATSEYTLAPESIETLVTIVDDPQTAAQTVPSAVYADESFAPRNDPQRLDNQVPEARKKSAPLPHPVTDELDDLLDEFEAQREMQAHFSEALRQVFKRLSIPGEGEELRVVSPRPLSLRSVGFGFLTGSRRSSMDWEE